MSLVLINRKLAAAYGREAVDIVAAGRYVAPSGRTVGLDDAIARAREGTVTYAPDDALEAMPARFASTVITIHNTTFACSFLTSPAPNAGAAIDHDTRAASRIQPALRERVARVLGVAAHHGHEALVLGAWGCGVFRCDPAMVADELGRALEGRFAGRFARVVFAIVDERPERSVIAPFERRFTCSVPE
jgi:hypothetical protein